MPMLIIGEAEKEQIAKLVAHAKANPVTLEWLRQFGTNSNDANHMKFEDRKPGAERPPNEHIIFPGNYRATYSIEEQPFGMCAHLSISVFGRDKPGMMPSPPAVAMIAEEFGVPCPAEHMWTEEYEPGQFAINMLSRLAR